MGQLRERRKSATIFYVYTGGAKHPIDTTKRKDMGLLKTTALTRGSGVSAFAGMLLVVAAAC
jgi:hypothetical protein